MRSPGELIDELRTLALRSRWALIVLGDGDETTVVMWKPPDDGDPAQELDAMMGEGWVAVGFLWLSGDGEWWTLQTRQLQELAGQPWVRQHFQAALAPVLKYFESMGGKIAPGRPDLN